MIGFRSVLLAEPDILERYKLASSKPTGVEADFATGKQRFAVMHANAVQIATNRVESREAAVYFDPVHLTA